MQTVSSRGWLEYRRKKFAARGIGNALPSCIRAASRSDRRMSICPSNKASIRPKPTTCLSDRCETVQARKGFPILGTYSRTGFISPWMTVLTQTLKFDSTKPRVQPERRCLRDCVALRAFSGTASVSHRASGIDEGRGFGHGDRAAKGVSTRDLRSSRGY